MSITRHMSEMTENPFGLSDIGHRCFHCGEFLQDPAVCGEATTGRRFTFMVRVSWIGCLASCAMCSTLNMQAMPVTGPIMKNVTKGQWFQCLYI